MKRATIAIPEELERAVEKYRRDLEVSPSLASVVQTALKAYLEERGYFAEDGGEDEIIPSAGGKPRGLRENVPKLKGGPPMADTVIEDRR